MMNATQNVTHTEPPHLTGGNIRVYLVVIILPLTLVLCISAIRVYSPRKGQLLRYNTGDIKTYLDRPAASEDTASVASDAP